MILACYYTPRALIKFHTCTWYYILDRTSQIWHIPSWNLCLTIDSIHWYNIILTNDELKLLSLTWTELDWFREIAGTRSFNANILDAATLAFMQSGMYARFLPSEELPRNNARNTLQRVEKRNHYLTLSANFGLPASEGRDRDRLMVSSSYCNSSRSNSTNSGRSCCWSWCFSFFCCGYCW